MRLILGLLDRHIFKNVFVSCVMAVGFFTFVVTTANALRDLLTPFLAGRLSGISALKLLLLLTPYAVTYALPMGVLCGVLLVLGRMSAESEVTAMRAAGLSLTRIARPIYILAALGSLLALAINLEYMPRSRTLYQQELLNAVRTDPMKLLVPRTFIRDFSRMVVYVGAREGDVLKDVWLWQLDREQRVIRFVKADSGVINYDDETNELIFTPPSSVIENRDPKAPENFRTELVTATTESFQFRFPLDRLLGKKAGRNKPEWLPFAALQREIARLSEPAGEGEDVAARGQRLLKLRMVVQDKFAMALAVLTFALVAVPLGIKVARRETSANLGIAVALALSYYFLNVAVKWLDNPKLGPELLLWVPFLLWVPNAIFLGLGLALTARVQRA